jgi:hypothetical protein
MNMTEFKAVQNMTYLEYCDYLQGKYGIGLADYMTKSYNPNPKCKRTKEGLIAHHKMEDRAIMIADKNQAQLYPFEYQRKENIVYCDYLEHLWLHILICNYPEIPIYELSEEKCKAFVNQDDWDSLSKEQQAELRTELSRKLTLERTTMIELGEKPNLVGVGGVVNFIVPELNDLYSGWQTNQEWRKKCHDKIIQDKDVYLQLIREFISTALEYQKSYFVEGKNKAYDVPNVLFTSYNNEFGLWDISRNEPLFKEIQSIFDEVKKLYD